MEIRTADESRIIEKFLKEFFGADRVELDDECVEVCFTYTHIDPDDGQKDDVLQVAILKLNQRLANVIV